MYTNDTLKDRVALIAGGGTELGLEIERRAADFIGTSNARKVSHHQGMK